MVFCVTIYSVMALIEDLQIIVDRYLHNIRYHECMNDLIRFSGTYLCETFLTLREEAYQKSGKHMMDYSYEFLCPPKRFRPMINIYESINRLMLHQKDGVIYDGEWRFWWN